MILLLPIGLLLEESSRFARFGLSREDIQKISNMDIKRSSDGQVTNWNHDNWSDQELSKKFIRYLGRATRESVVLQKSISVTQTLPTDIGIIYHLTR